MHRSTFAILDTETTGFSPNRWDRMIEIAIVKIREWKIEESTAFSTLLNPWRKIPASATRVHRITDDMVVDAPLFWDKNEEMIKFLSDVDYLFIHNAKFDLWFLDNEAKLSNTELILPKIVCSVELSKQFYPTKSYHNLNSIAKSFWLSIKSGELRHRALGDVILTAEAIIKFYEENALTFYWTLEQIANTKYVG